VRRLNSSNDSPGRLASNLVVVLRFCAYLCVVESMTKKKQKTTTICKKNIYAFVSFHPLSYVVSITLVTKNNGEKHINAPVLEAAPQLACGVHKAQVLLQ